MRGFIWVAMVWMLAFFPASNRVLAVEGNPGDRGVHYALHTSKLGSLDPHFSKGSQDVTYADMVFNALLRYVPGDSRQIEPDLARELPRFEIINKHQVWTVRLKQGVYFHESPHFASHELTAQDVVFSLKKAGDPETCDYSGLYQGMTFEIEDKYTLRIILEQPISPLFFFPRIANWKGGYVLSSHMGRDKGYADFLSHPVGTGPFQFKSYKTGDCLALEANPRYFRGKPKLADVKVYFTPDNARREAAFLNGEMDVIYGIGEPGWLSRMEKIPGNGVDVFGPGYTGLIHFNTAIPPLNDRDVRAAISHALDREKLMAGTSRRLVSPVFGPMSPAFLPGAMDNEMIKKLKLESSHSLETAQALMARAGYPDGFSLEVPMSEKRLYQDIYKELKAQLAKINIQVTLNKVSHSQYHQVIRQNSSPLVVYFTFRPDADNYLRGFFHSDSIVKIGKTPHTNFSNFKGVDKLLDTAVFEVDPRKQKMLWEQAQIKILSQNVVYPLFDINQCVVRKQELDYGHHLKSTLAQYPQFNETTQFVSVQP